LPGSYHPATAEELKAYQKKMVKRNQEHNNSLLILGPVFIPDLSLSMSQKEPQHCGGGSRKGCPTLHWPAKLKSALVIALWLPHPLRQCRGCQEGCRMQARNLNRVREFRPTPQPRKPGFFLALQCSVSKARIVQTFWLILAQQNCKRQKVGIKPSN